MKAKIFLIFWGGFVATLLSLLMASHLLTMPVPEDPEFLRRSLVEDLNLQTGNYKLIHFLNYECNCSEAVGEHLVERRKHSDTEEYIYAVDSHQEFVDGFVATGFSTKHVSMQDLVQKFRAQSVPLLVVLDEENELRYLGGYYRQRAYTEAQDIKILDKIRLGALTVEALPLYGCAMSKELRDAVDPLALKYDREEEESHVH